MDNQLSRGNMKMKKEIKITLAILTAIFGCACLLFCGWLFGTDREPTGFNIPKADIIYQALNHRLSIQDESNNLIGFVNADGSGNTLIKLKYRAYYPVFSLEAGGLFFHENLPEPTELQGIGGGPTYFLSSSGIYKDCNSLFAEQFIFPVSATGYLLEYDSRDIELADMKTCKVIKQLVYNPDGGAMVDSAYPSYSGKSVIFTESFGLPLYGVIYIIDIETGTVREVLQGGSNASFSPDDQRIAYVGDDGIYVANADGTGSKLIVRIDFNSYEDRYAESVETPFPIWSPDGTTLVYHKCTNEACHDLSDFSIYKVDVNSGQEQKIIDGGLYPVWIK
jgi:hypothetical protein